MGVHSGPKFTDENLYTGRLFTSSGVFTPAFTGTIEVLVVAGGGGGGMDMGGGGGGGGVISNTTYSVTSGTPITVTVGAGGYGAPAGNGGYRLDGQGPQPNQHQFTISATNGTNSVFGLLTAVGGGYGGSSYFGYTPNNGYGNSGGSGGGASGYSDGNTGRGGTGTAGQGNAGGGSTGQYFSGGGGGAGAAGGSGNNPDGGAGVLNTILGRQFYWGGGGGGASYSSSIGGNGGIGGGGGGAVGATTGGRGYNSGLPGGGGSPNSWTQTPGGNGGQHTGGGGGGGSHYNATNKGGEGGSGIVIVRYLSSLGTSTGGSRLSQTALKFFLDMQNTDKSWKGVPTTNLAPETMTIYNNVPSDVTVTLEATQEKYLGATVYKETITPITANGVSFTTGGNNPGIGVVVPSVGGGLANRSTGHAIFYKPDCALHTTPLFTNYSNITGWGAGPLGSDRSVPQGDGWFRGEVVWFDTVTRSDGKYWAINPRASVLNSSMVVYWAAPFKEDRNDNTLVSRYVKSSRSQTQGLLDLTDINTVTINNLTYSTSGNFRFDGTDDYISVPVATGTTRTVCITYKLNNPGAGWGPLWREGDWKERIFPGTITLINSNTTYYYLDGPDSTSNIIHIAYSYNGTNAKSYRNGVLQSNITMDGPMDTGTFTYNFGRQAGGSTTAFVDMELYSVQFYDSQLTDEQVLQNFNSIRGRFGI